MSKPPRPQRPLVIALITVSVLGLVVILVVAAMAPAHTVTGTALPADQYGPQDTATRTKPLPTTTTAAPQATIAALTPGWQTAYSISRNAVYDVPQDWTVPTPTTIIGFESGNSRVVMSGAAELQPKSCDGHHTKAMAGVTGSKLGDTAAAAKDVATDWATIGGSNDDRPNATFTLSPVETLTVQGKPAAHVTATLTNPAPYDCSHPATAVVHTIAVAGNNGQSVVMVVFADQNVDGATTTETIRQMFNTLRPAGLKPADCKQDNQVVGTWCN
ncbi:hypothetical protein [Nocardia seriolae]|nr:hypothetical protein [Nocardia seriolae]MTJ62212.1 hypothetical protein [Nocardia seriolae]MTJ74221.1 hypothetical protein [Nocardia seriolae]MTJ87121.1 hypothetical protein [Nocardia seriolae]MTK31115.1 hypothetical protein [Nocardia seriolae]MTK40162.1 hypothetical protein [Nocardia seriolae]